MDLGHINELKSKNAESETKLTNTEKELASSRDKLQKLKQEKERELRRAERYLHAIWSVFVCLKGELHISMKINIIIRFVLVIDPGCRWKCFSWRQLVINAKERSRRKPRSISKFPRRLINAV